MIKKTKRKSGQTKLQRQANKKVDPKSLPKVYYKTEMVKKNGEILWRAVEKPSDIVLKESFFEEDVKAIVKFQNKNKTFGIFGFPKFFDIREDKEKSSK